jgi:hypothetical protein
MEKVKRLTEGICRVNNEEENSKASAMPSCSFHVNLERLIDVAIVKRAKDLLGSEGLSSANGRDDLLCETTTFGGMLERESDSNFSERLNIILRQDLLHVRRDKFVHDTARDSDARQDRGHCQSQSPVTAVG